MLFLPHDAYQAMVGHAYDELPLEACGLLGGELGGSIAKRYYPCANDAGSSKLYTVNARDHLRSDRDAEDRGGQIIGVVHSHTHTESYPSPTDVAQAPDANWHYLIVSLKHEEPVVRGFRIVDGEVSEEQITLTR